MHKGQQTKTAIVDVALSLATQMGLEGLTIGAVAEMAGMSKSGVFAHFGSREDLQSEVLKLYHHHFEQEVFYPSLKDPRGLPRLQAMFGRWVRRVSRDSIISGSSTETKEVILTILKPARASFCRSSPLV